MTCNSVFYSEMKEETEMIFFGQDSGIRNPVKGKYLFNLPLQFNLILKKKVSFYGTSFYAPRCPELAKMWGRG